ncbi:ribonuclease-3 [Rhizomicrobium palustre]|uniref:Ribonuclease 3 n=1 Tax=Rhizomicrobium palustre TaxID=189966 RepID=A0A846N2Z9_9PROT|nr:ribonuclease-3 [Rhizomicrobium palustre]
MSSPSGIGRGPSASPASSARSTEALAGLEERLGHTFKDKHLLRRALTHASASGSGSNERLEFLGDRVLGLIAAEKLHEIYPKDNEGDLALKFNHLVRAEACAAAAEASGIADHLILARSEQGSGGRRKIAITSGATEAVIAALYLDGGVDAAKRFIERYWVETFASLTEEMRDAKTRLQEWAQSRGAKSGAPVYKVVGREGPDHAPVFSVEVAVIGKEPQTGTGTSKREAEQDAARKMLISVGKAV